MKTITIEIPEGKRAEWVNGVLTLVDDKPKVEFKFKVGERVIHDGKTYKISGALIHCGEPTYRFEGVEFITQEWLIEGYAPKDITEHIKTFEDACKWCKENHRCDLVEQYHDAINVGLQRSPDLLAYLKLRIITCALNEGWEPTFERCVEQKWYPYYRNNMVDSGMVGENIYCNDGRMLYFKSKELSEYAAKQFRDIYMDFCYKGKE